MRNWLVGPVVASGPWCGRCHLATASPPNGRLSQSEQQVVPARHLVTATAPHWLLRLRNQWVAPLRHLVTQRWHLAPCANSRDGAPATPGPGRRSRGRGSNFGSRAWHASGLGWRPCWPLCNQTPNSKIGDGDYVGQHEIIWFVSRICG